MRDSAVLFDVTKCVGCGSCTVACKMWNGLPYEENAHGYDVKLDDKTWTVVEYRDVKKGKEEALRFVKHQCMHCLEPSCVAVCFAKAITVSDEGAVVYDAKKCVGCRYCMIGCPYSVPKYEWDKVFPSVMKCRLCAEKLATRLPLPFALSDTTVAKARLGRMLSESRYQPEINGLCGVILLKSTGYLVGADAIMALSQMRLSLRSNRETFSPDMNSGDML